MKLKSTLIICSVLAMLTSCGEPQEQPQHHQDPVTIDIDFTTIDLGGKNQIFGTEASFKTKIMEAANSTLLTDVTVSENNTVKVEESDFPSSYTNVQGLIVGTSSNDGEFSLTFSKKIQTVTIKVQQYYNLFVEKIDGKPYNSARFDGQRYVESPEGDYYEGYFEIGINGENFEGPGETYVYDENWDLIITIPEIVTKEFTIDSTSLTISGFKSVRTRIYEMSFQFEAE